MAKFDVIVVGAGHAGVEAALAAFRLKKSVLVITTNVDRIGFMSCNPSIGGLGKGHIVREIDILGGAMGYVADQTCIQFKRLNAKKGPAVRGSRAQCDKDLYSSKIGEILRAKVQVIEGEVKRLLIENNRVTGVVLGDGSEIFAGGVVLTTGTFMNAVMHVGFEQTQGGRVGDQASIGLSDQLKSLGFSVERLKTGTPARLDKNTIDWSQTTPQAGDEKFFPFSFRSSTKLELPQVLCYLSRTTEETHEIIRKNLDKSPMYAGIIEGVGPRYCPSIEDKIVRFAERDSHQTFLEPEGLNTNSIYLQGISTSLPYEIQDKFLRTIPGLKDVGVLRYGYAVEYDFMNPLQITHSLETKAIRGLFFAGQINGTSGYEEAAGQGLVAGTNVCKYLENSEPFVLGRHEAYIGVMIDDLVTKGAEEPYRMFTSRAEHRLILREDNVFDRLGVSSQRIGLTTHEELSGCVSSQSERQVFHETLKKVRFFPNGETNWLLKELGTSPLLKPLTGEELLRRNDVDCSVLEKLGVQVPNNPMVFEPVEIEVKYSGYIRRQNEVIEEGKKLEEMSIQSIHDYSKIRGLSKEEIEKLNLVRPRTLGQMQRISGVNPSAIQAMIVFLKGNRLIKE